MGLVATGLAAVGAGLGIRELVRYSDTWTTVTNRLRLATNGSEELQAATQRVFDIAQSTRTQLQGTAELYQRLSISTQALSVSQETLGQVTENISQAITISGTSAESANAAIVQLGQGLAANALRGQELNSVLEQTPRVAQVLADELTGGSLSALRELAKQGGLTSERVIAAFSDQSASARALRAEFELIGPTVEQSLLVLQNSLTRAFGSFSENTGLARNLSESIILVSRSIDELTDRGFDVTSFFDEIGVQMARIIDLAPEFATAISQSLNPFDDVSAANARGAFNRRLTETSDLASSVVDDRRTIREEAQAIADRNADIQAEAARIAQQNRTPSLVAARTGPTLDANTNEIQTDVLNARIELTEKLRDRETAALEELERVQQENFANERARFEERRNMADQQRELRNSVLANAQEASASLVQLFGEQTAAGRAAFAIEKGLAAGRATIAVGEAIARANAATDPFTKAAAITQAISIGAQALATIRNARPDSGASVSGVSGSGGGFATNSASSTGISQSDNVGRGSSVVVNLFGADSNTTVNQRIENEQTIVDVLLNDGDRGGPISRQYEQIFNQRRTGTR